MSLTRALKGSVVSGIVAALVFAGVWGCGGDDFLGLEDYQRDLVAGGLIAAALLNQQAAADTGGEEPPAPVDGRDGEDGADGLSCWDLNGNGLADPAEDANGDGEYTALDCQGSVGPGGADGAAGPEGSAGAAGQDGSDGLSCWDLNGNRTGDPVEDTNADGQFDALDCRGAAGSSGANGEIGMSLFSIFIDEFFAPENLYRGLPIVLVEVREPALGQTPVAAGTTPYEAIAYRVAVPQMYNAGNDVTMRLYLYRTGPFLGDCFVFSLDARRLQSGSDVEPYGGTRWIRVDLPASVLDNGDAENGNDNDNGGGDVLLVVDLPLNTAAGLGFPSDLARADFLAFELASTGINDGGVYQILGVEFFESRAGTAERSGATVVDPKGDNPCGTID